MRDSLEKRHEILNHTYIMYLFPTVVRACFKCFINSMYRTIRRRIKYETAFFITLRIIYYNYIRNLSRDSYRVPVYKLNPAEPHQFHCVTAGKVIASEHRILII